MKKYVMALSFMSTILVMGANIQWDCIQLRVDSADSIGVWWHSGYISDGDSSYQGGTVPFVTRYAEDIQRIMDGLCPGYSLRFLDCSGFDRLSME